jgi:cell division protein FtsL
MAPDPNRNWFQRAFHQAPWRTQTQNTTLALAVVVIVAVIGALYLAQASRTAAAGRRLQALESQRQILEQQNAQLRAEIAALRSVPRLMAEAQQQGFHPASPDEVEYLLIQDVPPAPPPTPTPLPTAEEVVPAYNETLESWLSEQFAGLREQIQTFLARTFGLQEASAP